MSSIQKYGFFRDTPKNPDDKKIPVKTAFEFFSHLNKLYADLAMIQYFCAARIEGCNFLFHVEGKPLNYCTIQSSYRQALRKSNILYTGTHCLQHGMVTLACRVGGMGLDSVIAMTGHKDLKLADHYSKIDSGVQKETSNRIIEHIGELLGLKSEPQAQHEPSQ